MDSKILDVLIIGNGFDRAHKMETSFSHFIFHLSKQFLLEFKKTILKGQINSNNIRFNNSEFFEINELERTNFQSSNNLIDFINECLEFKSFKYITEEFKKKTIRA